MYIDFHVHAYPEKVVEKAFSVMREKVRESGRFDDDAACDGTATGLVNLLKKEGIDKAVLLPVATKASQPHSINTWVNEVINSELNKDGILFPFGAAHPDDPNLESELIRVKEMGCKGIKFHAESTWIYVDEPKMFKLYEICEELGLWIVFHCGADPITPDEKMAHCTPQRLANVLECFKKLHIIAAHMGGFFDYENGITTLKKYNERCLVDTACQAGALTPKYFSELVNRYGADRILFGSDIPWHNPKREIEMIELAKISDSMKEQIYYKNALRILNG